VLDVGCGFVKAGYAGESEPKHVFPSCVGFAPGEGGGEASKKARTGEGGASAGGEQRCYMGEGQLGVSSREMEVRYAMDDGMVSDWEALEKLWSHSLVDRLKVDPRQHPVLLTEPVHNTRSIRERMVSTMFEQHSTPAVFIAKNAVLSAFASGRSTALVLKSGSSQTLAVPIHEGYVLLKNVIRLPVSGNSLNALAARRLEEQGVSLRPHSFLSKKETSAGKFAVQQLNMGEFKESYQAFHAGQLLNDLKAVSCSVSPWRYQDKLAVPQAAQYALPDGNVIDLGSELVYGIAEEMLAPASTRPLTKDSSDAGGGAAAREAEAAPMEQDDAAGKGAGAAAAAGPKERASVADAIHKCIHKCDVDLKRHLYGAIVVTGGNTLYEGYVERLTKELAVRLPQQTKLNIIAPAAGTERQFSSWIGGSILGSLGTFNQLWISSAEFKESGANIVHSKCP